MDRKETEKGGARRVDHRAEWWISVVTLFVVAAIAVSVFFAMHKRAFDYLTTDLSRYVRIQAEDYHDMDFDILLDGVTEADVEEQILSILTSHRSENPSQDIEIHSGVMRAGDSAFLNYHGYTIDENGRRQDIPAGSNLFSVNGAQVRAGDPQELVLGSRSFISGFETGLIGKNTADHSRLDLRSGGESILEGDVLFLTYSALIDGEEARSATRERVVYTAASQERIAAEYGVGFYALLGTLTAGGTPRAEHEETLPDGRSVRYYSLRVEALLRDGANPITVEAYFPMTYSEPSLRGKTAYFDVYVSYFVPYDTPSLTDAFVTETLGMSEQDLSAYEGETLADRYRSLVRAGLERDHADRYTDAVSNAIIDHLMRVATVESVPEEAVAPIYEANLSDLEMKYQSYKNYMQAQGMSAGTIEYFAMNYYRIDAETPYQEYARTLAIETAKEKLVFYHVARAEGVLPVGDELKTLTEQLIDELLAYFVSQDASILGEQAYQSAQAFESALQAYRASMVDYYGEAYFAENAMYRYAMERLSAYANVHVVGRK